VHFPSSIFSLLRRCYALNAAAAYAICRMLILCCAIRSIPPYSNPFFVVSRYFVQYDAVLTAKLRLDRTPQLCRNCILDRLVANAVSMFYVQFCSDGLALLQEVVDGHDRIPLAGAVPGFGLGCARGVSGTITSSNRSWPTARRVKAKTPIAKLKIATPVTMFLNRYGRLARFRAAPVR